ncbi:unnamed protein product, partial [Timema podura]|nr:unnamed protein product [Timema podura]
MTNLFNIVIISLKFGLLVDSKLNYARPEVSSESISLTKQYELVSCYRNFVKNIDFLTIVKEPTKFTFVEELILLNLQTPRIILQLSLNESAWGVPRSNQVASSKYVMILLKAYDEEIMTKYLSQLSRYPLWDPRGRFLIIIKTSFTGQRREWLYSFFELFWSIKIANVFIVYLEDDVKSFENNYYSEKYLLRVVSYYPFGSGDLRKKDLTKEWLSQEGTSSFNPFRDIQGHTLRVSTTISEPRSFLSDDQTRPRMYLGPDSQLMKVITTHMNATAQVFSPSFPYELYLSNGTLLGSVGDVFNEKADLTGTFQVASYERAKLVDYTYPREIGTMIFIVPKSGRVAQYKNIFLPFSRYTWCALLSSFILATVGLCFLKMFSFKRTSRYSYWIHVGFPLLVILQNFFSVHTNSSRNIKRAKFFFLSWSTYSLIMTNAFQGSLTSYLAVPQFLPEIDTLEQLDGTDLVLKVYPNSARSLDPDNSSEMLIRLSRKFEDIRDITTLYDSVAFEGVTAVMATFGKATYLRRMTRYHRDGYPLLHLMSEPLVTQLISYCVPKHSVFLPRFNEIIGRVFEAGLPDKWFKDVIHQRTLVGVLSLEENLQTHKARTVLTLLHMQTPFYLFSM